MANGEDELKVLLAPLICYVKVGFEEGVEFWLAAVT